VSNTFLVTGAAGFIGSHVAQALLARGDTVVGFDNLNEYYSPARKEANLVEVRQSAAQPSQFVFVRGDVRDRERIARLFAEHSFAAVIHLGAMAGVRISITDPYLYYDVNLTGTLNLLNAARDQRVGNFVLASTSSIYGRTEQVPFVETDPCDRPLAPYAASKRAAEMLGFTYHHLYGQNFTVLRFFTVYGPRGRPDMLAYLVADNIFFGRPIPLYNGGQMHRDWTYIDDIVAGIVAAADRPLGYEIINLGCGAPVLLADFVRLIEEVTGRAAHLTPTPMSDADIAYTYADINKARRLLDYTPRVAVAAGVWRFWEWYQRAVLAHSVADLRMGLEDRPNPSQILMHEADGLNFDSVGPPLPRSQ
jgi:UDP-glucuronate 4-epimerase